ncbi:MAG TPA: nucleotide sugar dehydrogenase [Vicinamibacterales bacterium]|nr:nucleotide sugar dehydrogenase [Vicinamibacterales bacterium]
MKISVIGLGKLGAPLAAVLASKGFDVIGVDLNQSYVDALNQGQAPVEEPRLQELIDAHRARLKATASVDEAITTTDVTFVIVPTPSDSSGRFSNAAVLSAMKSIGLALRRKDGYHVVVITSTVMPGSTGGEIQQALEQHAGRRVGSQLGLCYNPEFIALGSVVRDMLRPDMILIGESDKTAGDLLESIYAKSCDNTPTIRRMNFVNAELTKISVNTFVTTKISYANMLADICDRLPGADVDVVTQAVGTDSRIGAKYLKGATGYGGPCFPRDNVAFARLARDIGARAELAEATDTVNRYQVDRVLGAVDARLTDSGVVGVLGLSYKPDTAVVEESQGLVLVERLLDLGRRVIVYDPEAIPSAQQALRRPFDVATSAAECVQRSSLVVVMTPWPEFSRIPVEAYQRSTSRLTVIDCWRATPLAVASVADVVFLGQGAAVGASMAGKA